MTDLRVLIGIATYNELDNLPVLVSRIRANHADIDVLVVDDSSPDGTAAWCRHQALRDSHLKLIQRPRKSGLGSAVRRIFRHAVDHQYEWLVTMDADLSHDPSELNRLLEAATNSDVVIGSRYVDGGAIADWPLRRRWASRLTNRFVQWLLGLQAQDCSSGYRVYRVSLLSTLDDNSLVSSGYGFYEEVLWRLQRRGARFTEVPITFVDRVAGKSKADLRQSLRTVTELLALRIRG